MKYLISLLFLSQSALWGSLAVGADCSAADAKSKLNSLLETHMRKGTALKYSYGFDAQPEASGAAQVVVFQYTYDDGTERRPAHVIGALKLDRACRVIEILRADFPNSETLRK